MDVGTAQQVAANSIQTQLLMAVIGGSVVGLVVAIINYFVNKSKKVDDMSSVYATKDEVEKIREKLDTFISREACKSIRSDCVGKNWEGAVTRLEATFSKKFDDLSGLLMKLMREVGYNSGKQSRTHTEDD